MSNGLTATTARWSLLARGKCRLINLLILWYIKLLNIILTFLYR